MKWVSEWVGHDQTGVNFRNAYNAPATIWVYVIHATRSRYEYTKVYSVYEY